MRGPPSARKVHARAGPRRSVAGRVWCPRDGTELRKLASRRAKGKVCPACAGVWFGAGQISRFLGDEELEREMVRHAADPAGIACPGCGSALATSPIGDAAAQVCTACRGIWVDRRDLEAAASTLEGPRLPDEARGTGRPGLMPGVSSIARTPEGAAAFARRRGKRPPGAP